MNKVLKQRPVVLLSLLTTTPETCTIQYFLIARLNIEQANTAAYSAAEIQYLHCERRTFYSLMKTVDKAKLADSLRLARVGEIKECMFCIVRTVTYFLRNTDRKF